MATLDFAPDGAALLSRRTSETDIGTEDSDRLATLSPDGSLVEHRPLRDRLAAAPVVFGRGRVALVHQTVLSKPDARARRVRISLSLGSVDKPLGGGRPRRLATYTPVPSDDNTGPALAVGPNSAIAIVWMEFRGDEFGFGRFRVRLAVRRPDGRFERTRTVAAGGVEGNRESHSVAVTFGARRDIVVAYARYPRRADARTIAVRTLRRGRRFGRPQTLGPHAGLVRLHAKASRVGRTIIAWATQDGGEEANTPSVVRAAIRTPRAARFGPTRVMDAGEVNGFRAPGRMRLAMAGDGTATLAWSNAAGRHPGVSFPVRVAVAEAGRDFGPVTQLAANGATGDVSVRADGAALVAWADVSGYAADLPSRETQAALRTRAGQPFGPPELVESSSGTERFSRQLSTAFDPLTGHASVVWTDSNRADVLRLATRSG